MLVTILLVFSTSVISFSTDTGNSLTDAIEKSQTTDTSGTTGTTDGTNGTGTTGDTDASGAPGTSSTTGAQDKTDTTGKEPGVYDKNSNFIDGLHEAADLTPDVEGAKTVTSGAKLVAAFIVQVLSYIIIAFLAVRILLDLAYIALPFTRTFLSNGYAGNPQQPGNMQPGMGGMGMGGMGGMGAPGMGGMGMGGMGGYGRGRYGGMGGMGMGGMGMQGGMGMGMNQAAGNQQNSMIGQVQFVSNAALNAVASESAIGPDGKTMNPFKIYIKDMTVLLIVTPILIVLAATGTITNLGFVIANALVDAIGKLGQMI